MNNISITFKNDGKIIRDPFNIGTLQELGVSDEIALGINHNSNDPIIDCGIFISPYAQYYAGTENKDIDYNKVLWFADNFPGYGLFLKQEFVVYGEVYRQDSRRLIDVSRTETKDIFTGFQIQMLSGISNGEIRTITGYDPINSLFNLDDDFTAALEGDRYKIILNTEHVFKSQQGSSENYTIPLLFNAGRINRFEQATISLQLKIPPFMKRSGRHFFDLNLKYTPGQ